MKKTYLKPQTCFYRCEVQAILAGSDGEVKGGGITTDGKITSGDDDDVWEN